MHKYTNIKCLQDPTGAIFLTSMGFKLIKELKKCWKSNNVESPHVECPWADSVDFATLLCIYLYLFSSIDQRLMILQHNCEPFQKVISPLHAHIILSTGSHTSSQHLVGYVNVTFRDGLLDQMFPKYRHCQDGGGSDPCLDFFEGFVHMHWGPSKVIIYHQKVIFPHKSVPYSPE